MTGSAPTPRSAWLWAALGAAGSVLVAYAAPRAVDDRVVGWWYMPGAPSGRGTSLALVCASALVAEATGVSITPSKQMTVTTLRMRRPPEERDWI